MTGGASGVVNTQQISTVEYVNNNKRQIPFIPADGHAKTPRISEFSRDWCSVQQIGKVEVC